MDQTTHILALEARLDEMQASLMAHDLLVRSLLAHLALADPEAFKTVEQSLGALKFFRQGGGGGELPREVADEIALILGEIDTQVAKRR
ncbi:MAG TPA: hypothetical protein VLI41_04805 [Phenylobacterium sp.]|uniref:hypothetical protein n=1 Tax=Phenylobacterium sp. TaxID=1871053 RepID=UPI002C15CAAC|nr:hypothetical protein [Phenylobacterium sp.]HSV02505.1 hypothetical protein [Phenylobacterium sp.]